MDVVIGDSEGTKNICEYWPTGKGIGVDEVV